VLDVAAGTVTGGGTGSADRASFANVEQFYGTRFADRMTGDDNANVLGGMGGNDTLYGAGGNDILDNGVSKSGDALLDGGAGNDTLTGGFGADTFAFTSAPGTANADVVTDFISGTDKIALDALAMPAIGDSGQLSF